MKKYRNQKRKLFRNKNFQEFSKRIVSIFIRILSSTYRYEVSGDYPDKGALFIFWHRNLMPLIYNRRNEKIGVMVSSSSDGDFIATAVEMLGFIPVRGSSAKNGARALKEMISISKEHSLAITPDGPKGPIYDIKEGAFVLAYLAKIPIIPIKLEISREWTFKSWDSFRIPKPFAKINVTYGDSLMIENKKMFADYKSNLTSQLGK